MHVPRRTRRRQVGERRELVVAQRLVAGELLDRGGRLRGRTVDADARELSLHLRDLLG